LTAWLFVFVLGCEAPPVVIAIEVEDVAVVQKSIEECAG
jgi:hypothetical protein